MDINGAEILDGFVLGHFAAQYAQQLGKGFLANLLNGLIAGNDQTAFRSYSFSCAGRYWGCRRS